MTQHYAVVAVYTDHGEADAAVAKLIAGGFAMKDFSVIGKGYHTEEKIVGFYNTGERMKFWGKYGAFWGGLWGIFFGGVFLSIPALGPVVVLGYLAATVVSAIEGAIVVGGLTALGAALFSIGIPKDSVVQYEAAVKADGFLIITRGTAEALARAKAILATSAATSLALHPGMKPLVTIEQVTAADI